MHVLNCLDGSLVSLAHQVYVNSFSKKSCSTATNKQKMCLLQLAKLFVVYYLNSTKEVEKKVNEAHLYSNLNT